MTANEVIILVILIAVTIAILCFLLVFIIEHFSGHSVYDQPIRIYLNKDGNKEGDTTVIEETNITNTTINQSAEKSNDITAEELVIALRNMREQDKRDNPPRRRKNKFRCQLPCQQKKEEVLDDTGSETFFRQ